ncbi:MAG: ABC transporter ATP-binding protein [Microbacterium sp. 14-71-5]|jgi:peptide/nickel transport system ATP-binding protein|uniref:ABC transporter ATP-binding protein n=1 Tax=Microbacterium sp. 13-71-7 TaxID=1970399 RepID=UPI000BC847C8|nr:ABC transporter ATP-binding protein [Microbacterium sp. 13-71-7]OZB83791.1 MAG: ABC transporter ATP-binding protein [Microbacterium sp. 13-71-7]OZB89034.1 MAG: ABC transporter ATP-binding protein [Microbacterium sp. 14-71-5]
MTGSTLIDTSAAATATALLDIRELTLDLADGTRLLHGITLSVAPGETVGLVGESGSGKSLTARTVLGLTPDRAEIGGSVSVDGRSPLAPATLRSIRRADAAMVFQDPRAGINPMRTIGDHLTEALRLNEGWSRSRARARAAELLADVRLPSPAEHLDQHPHELSGGMLQRVMIAGALTTSPRLLVCDEPTTALDVTTQAEIVQVLRELCAERGMGMLFITHDLNLAGSLCDRLVVMKDGAVVEEGPALDVLRAPQAEYTRRLVAATPRLTGDVAALSDRETATGRRDSALEPQSRRGDGVSRSEGRDVEVSGVSKTYRVRGRGEVHAVADATLRIPTGGALAVVGESGSGKSTLARMIVGLEQVDTGTIRIGGRDAGGVPKGREERLARAKSVQMVFQDPYLSLDPRIPAGRAVADVLRLHAGLDKTAANVRALELLTAVGLGEEHAAARPKTLSGGQRQRVAIARALAIEPDLLVMDEATSALDVSVQAQVLDLVADIRRRQGLTLLFISHDLAVVRRVCEQTLVMRRGEIVERGATAELLTNPQHEYTRLLLDSVPVPV